MIIINTLEDIEKAEITPKELKEEILQHFQDIAESVVDKYWKMYNLKEVVNIRVIEDDDSIEVLVWRDRYYILATCSQWGHKEYNIYLLFCSIKLIQK